MRTGVKHEPLRPQVIRYATWFVEADWPLKTVANLFEVPAEALLNALDPQGAA